MRATHYAGKILRISHVNAATELPDQIADLTCQKKAVVCMCYYPFRYVARGFEEL